MGGSSSAGFCCAYASPSTRHGAPLRTDVDARDISSGPQARAQGQAQAVQAVQAEQKRKATANNASTRLAGVNAREREPGEGWRVLETAVVRVQAGGANCCTGESTRLATDWTASRTRTERMARERQSQVELGLELKRRRGCLSGGPRPKKRPRETQRTQIGLSRVRAYGFSRGARPYRLGGYVPSFLQ
jgi:hypothetical protein